MINRLNKITAFLLVSMISGIFATTNSNLFQPYDILLRPRMPRNSCWHLSVAYEGSFDECSFQAEENEYEEEFRKCRKILQLFQDEQDAIAALKGADFDRSRGELATLLNRHDDTGAHGLFVPEADLDIHNIMVSGYYFISPTTNLEAHLPIIAMDLEKVRWREKNSENLFEDLRIDDFISQLERVGAIDLGPWDRSGVGDLAVLLSWRRAFSQGKPFLRSVTTGIRGGFILPTGKDADEDRLLALPFGHGAGFGLLANGFIEARVLPKIRFGIDLEFTHLIGDSRPRRIKTDEAQTDLLFLTKINTYREPGFKQHYTLYGQYIDILPCVSARLAYQFTRQEDSRIFLGSDRFDSRLANSAESLFEWTTHSIVTDLSYEPLTGCWPSLSLLVKHGFNGQRAILIDSAAVRLGFCY